LVKTWQLSEIDGQWGLEQEYRDNIRANEKEVSLNSDDFSTNEFLSASQYNAALFGNINYRLNDWSFTVGARANYIEQASGYDLPGHEDRSDSAATYFLAAAYQLAPEWRLNGSVSTGFRFPTVTERFYNGMTARGQTFGNPELKPETARNLELGLSYNQDDYGFELNVFSNHISDYIERINLDEDTRTYRNLSEGTIKGLEFGFNHQLTDGFSYELSGHHLNGEDENGNPIADISPNKLQLALNYIHNHWQARLKLKHRFAHNEVASGEQTLDAVDIVTGDISYQLTDNLKLTVWADNLLDKAYTLTSDKKSAFATERQYGLTLSWQME
jgi:iron complex outermembrane receptor protein